MLGTTIKFSCFQNIIQTMSTKKRKTRSSSKDVPDNCAYDADVPIPMPKRIREFHSKHRVLSSQVNEAFEERFNELDSRPEPPEKANPWKVPHNFRVLIW